jgi:hypothetical protein
VKNGDRWTILNLTRTGGLTVRHVWNGRTVTLPAHYVQTSVELGYASTVHTAQGVTADTMHAACSSAGELVNNRSIWRRNRVIVPLRPPVGVSS